MPLKRRDFMTGSVAVAGGSAAFLQPGLYAYVNHNLIEAFDLGALGHVIVEGSWNNDLTEQVLAPSEY